MYFLEKDGIKNAEVAFATVSRQELSVFRINASDIDIEIGMNHLHFIFLLTWGHAFKPKLARS